MTNTRRFHLPDVPQHIVQRGNDGLACFRCDDDREEFLFRLAAAARKRGVAVHAYVLMTNHVHLLATPSSPDGAARMMQAVGGGYVRMFNARYGRTGTLWDGRYFSSLVGADAYFWNCHRYIESNPVRAGIVGAPAQYRWSSFGRNALGRADPVVTPHAAYLALSDDPPAAYRQLFGTALSEASLAEIRLQLWTERAYGDESFVQRVEASAPRSPRPCRSWFAKRLTVVC